MKIFEPLHNFKIPFFRFKKNLEVLNKRIVVFFYKNIDFFYYLLT